MYNSNEYLGLLSDLNTFLIFGFVVAYLILLSCIYTYANRLGRDGGVWVFFSLLFSPLLGALALWLKGETDEHRKERLVQERKWIMSVSNDMKELQHVISSLPEEKEVFADTKDVNSEEKDNGQVDTSKIVMIFVAFIVLLMIVMFLAFL